MQQKTQFKENFLLSDELNSLVESEGLKLSLEEKRKEELESFFEEIELSLDEADLFLDEGGNALENINLTSVKDDFDPFIVECVDELFLADQTFAEMALFEELSNYSCLPAELDYNDPNMKDNVVSDSLDASGEDADIYELDDDDEFDEESEEYWSEGFYKNILDTKFTSNIYAKTDAKISNSILDSIYPSGDDLSDIDIAELDDEDIIEEFASFDHIYGKDIEDSTLDREKNILREFLESEKVVPEYVFAFDHVDIFDLP